MEPTAPAHPMSRSTEEFRIAAAAQQASYTAATGSKAEDVLLLSDLGLTDELLVANPYGYTLKVNWTPSPPVTPAAGPPLLITFTLLSRIRSLHSSQVSLAMCLLACLF